MQAGSKGESAAARGDLIQMLRTAAGAYERGDLQRAESLCRQVLGIEPAQPDALHVLGLTDWQRGRREDAVANVRRAIAARPDRPQPHNSLGVMLRERGDLQAAEQAFRRALQLAPDYVEALTNLGNILGETDRLAEAESVHRRVTALAPGYADGHNNLATVLFKQERLDEAAQACRAAVALAPTRADIHLNLGNVLAEADSWDEAAQEFQRAAELAPANADAHAGLGIALTRLERIEDAAAAHRRAVNQRPSDAKLWSNLSFAEVDLGNADAAVEASRRALALDPHMAEPYNSLGAALKLQGHHAEAIVAYETAIRLRPDYGKAYNNLGVALAAQSRFAEASAAYDKAVALGSDVDIARWNIGLHDLLLGRFETGWRGYEHGLRMRKGRAASRRARFAPWTGSDPSNKTLLLWSEQGVGDQIMFAGLLPDLRSRGARCIVEADPRLEPLFRRAWPDLAFCPAGTDRPVDMEQSAIDLEIPLGGLCRWLRPTLASFPARSGYLCADSTRVAELRGRYCDRFGGRKIVGLSWRGGTGETAPVRSIPLAAWSPILRQSACSFVNLQYGDHRAELAEAERKIGAEILTDASVDSLKDLDSFAAQVAALDLVISVDNTTVHMAGALNVPVWVLLPKVPDWRWLLDRDDSPWYPSVRLFRQRHLGEWAAVIADIADRLHRLTDGG